MEFFQEGEGEKGVEEEPTEEPQNDVTPQPVRVRAEKERHPQRGEAQARAPEDTRSAQRGECVFTQLTLLAPQPGGGRHACCEKRKKPLDQVL